MIDGAKPYAATKDSGVPWLGAVPAHWEQRPGRSCYVERQIPNTGLRQTTVLSLSYGRIVVKPADRLHGLVPKSFETYQIIEPGDVVVRPTDLQNDWNSLRVGLSDDRGIITSAYMCLRSKGGMTSEFGYLLLHAYDLMKVFYGLGSGLRQNLDWSDFRHLSCVVPPVVEQIAIVRYLYHVDRRIRRYIRGKQKLIKLLDEQKQAIIHNAVVRGLDPGVRLRASGVPWLGAVPCHWVVASLRFRYHQCLGKMVDAKRQTGKYLVPYLRNVDVQWDRVNTRDLPRIDIAPEERDRYTVRVGDLLVCEGRHLGRAAFWRGELPECGFQKALHRLRPLSRATDAPRWLFYCLYVVHRLDAFGASSADNSIPHLTGEMLRAHKFPFPPLEEQNTIAKYLDERVQTIEQAQTAVVSEIRHMREYRTRLIADVVTGKLDVREAAARLPDEVEDVAPLQDAEADIDAEELDAGDDAAMDEAEA
jgi:type I restriction enzyme S subunit